MPIIHDHFPDEIASDISNSIGTANIFNQDISFGLMYAGWLNQEYYAVGWDTYAYISNGSGFSNWQFLIDKYGGQENIPTTTHIYYFDDDSELDHAAGSTFAVVLKWVNGRAFVYSHPHNGTVIDPDSSYYTSIHNRLIGNYNYKGALPGIDGGVILTARDFTYGTTYYYRIAVPFDATNIDHDSGVHLYNPDTAMSWAQPGGYYHAGGSTDGLTDAPTVNSGQDIADAWVQAGYVGVDPYPYADLAGNTWIPSWLTPESIYYAPGFNIYTNWHFPDFACVFTEELPFDQDLNEVNEDATGYIGGTGMNGQGGNGTGGFQSDSMTFPPVPANGFADTGMYRTYAPEWAELRAFAHYLWDYNNSLLTAFKAVTPNPMDTVINLGLLPLDLGPITGASAPLLIGNVDTNLTMTSLTQEYIEVDMGTLSVDTSKLGLSGTYLDYEPYCQYEIFLPFVGYVPILGCEVVNKSVHLRYNINVITGDFQAFLLDDGQADIVIGEYAGNMMQSCPVTSADYSAYYKNVFGAAISSGVSAIGSAISGNLPGAIGNALEAIGAVGFNGTPAPNVQRSGTLTGASAMLSCKAAYLVLRKPKIHTATNHNKFSGYLDISSRKLDSVSGFTQMAVLKNDGFSGTDQEYEEVVQLLKEGVYF